MCVVGVIHEEIKLTSGIIHDVSSERSKTLWATFYEILKIIYLSKFSIALLTDSLMLSVEQNGELATAL